MKPKIYGNEKTHLTLSALAEKVNAVTDPLDIAEYADEDGGYYYQIRVDYTDGFNGHYTAEEVSEYIESFVDDDWTFTLNMDEPERWGAEAENGMEITYGEIKRLAREWDVPIDSMLKEVE